MNVHQSPLVNVKVDNITGKTGYKLLELTNELHTCVQHRKTVQTIMRTMYGHSSCVCNGVSTAVFF